MILTAASPIAVETVPEPEPLAPVVHVLLSPPEAPGFRWGAETAGLVTAQVEQGLSQLVGVSPQVIGTPVLPGLTRPLAGGELWSGWLALGDDPDVLQVTLTLCPAAGACLDHGSVASWDAPFEAVAAVLVQASQQLGRSPTVDPRSWRQPPSTDAYAVLMLGRAASVSYGLGTPVQAADLGDRRRDPVARAVWIDPTMEAGQGLLGRRGGAEAVHLDAYVAAVHSAGEGDATVHAHLAVALDQAGEHAAAAPHWRTVQRQIPDDPRFVVPRLESALAVGQIDTVLDELLRLGERLPPDPAVSALRVGVADAADASRAVDLDVLLEDWQAVDPGATEPVRLRLALCLERRAWQDALALVGELEARGAVQEAQRVRVALSAQLGWLPAAGLPIEQLDAQLLEADSRVSHAEAAAINLAILHNRWARRVAEQGAVGCEEGAKIRWAGAILRDAVQAARADRDLLRGTLGSASISPLLSEVERGRVDVLDERVERGVVQYLEARAWSARFVEPQLARCPRETP